MRLVLICVLLFFASLHPVWAQKAKYSGAITGDKMYVVGAVGNTIHAWCVSQKSRKIFKELNLLTLHIFSPGLDLIDEKKISLGESEIKRIDFQMEHSFYYMNIVYTTRVNKRLMFKIDAAGNLTDVTNIPWLLNKTHYTPGSLSVAANSSNFFEAKISASVADSGIVNASLPPGENYDNKQFYEKLAVRKIDIGKRQLVAEKVYASGYLNFSRVLVAATDSTVYAAAFAQSKTGIDENPYKGSYLFLIRLDTNLAEPANGSILLKNKQWPANLLFIPNAIFPLHNRLLVFSLGLYGKTNLAYHTGSRTDTGAGFPKVFDSYVPGSIVITQADENNRLLADTIINIQEGQEYLDWGNRFILHAGNEVHLFCSHWYTASKAGIRLFTIGQDGKINTRDFIVEEKYAYALRQAISLQPGVLLVPYTYKRKMGLMTLAYGTTE